VPNQVNVVRSGNARSVLRVSRLRLPGGARADHPFQRGWGRTLLWTTVVSGVAVSLRLYAADRSLCQRCATVRERITRAWRHPEPIRVRE
jgi:hypothetical protein